MNHIARFSHTAYQVNKSNEQNNEYFGWTKNTKSDVEIE